MMSQFKDNTINPVYKHVRILSGTQTTSLTDPFRFSAMANLLLVCTSKRHWPR